MLRTTLNTVRTNALMMPRRQAIAAIHTSTILRNAPTSGASSSSGNNDNKNTAAASIADLLGTTRSTSSSSMNNLLNSNRNNTNNNNSAKSLLGSFGLAGGNSRFNNNSNYNDRSDLSLFGFAAPKANTTANPIHLDIGHETVGRSFKVNSAAAVDQTYRRLRSALNQSNMKRELRLRRTYETGHMRMRREKQETNKKLFGAMVKKKIELIKLMKIRGM